MIKDLYNDQDDAILLSCNELSMSTKSWVPTASQVSKQMKKLKRAAMISVLYFWAFISNPCHVVGNDR